MRLADRRMALLVALVLTLLLQSVPVLAQQSDDRTQAKDCSLPLTGFVPLTDLGEGSYQGAEGGLYPGGTNEMPPDHATLGSWHASQIEPLDSSGAPSSDGKVALISIGVSNTFREFDPFSKVAKGKTAPEVVLANGAQGGEPISNWTAANDETWDAVDDVLRDAGVTPEQVQAAWVKLPERITSIEELEPFPTDAETYQSDLEQVLRVAKQRYPNLRIAFLSSRIYAGYTTSVTPSPEPLAYQHGFGVKWTIQSQIDGDPLLNADPRRGEINAPWLGWGPYLWADGSAPRSDGLAWSCRDLRGDGVHPSNRGGEKVGDLLLEHFTTHPVASSWFSLNGPAISTFDLPPLPDQAQNTTTTVEVAPVTTSTAGAESSTSTVGAARDDTARDKDARDQSERSDQAQGRPAGSEDADRSPVIAVTAIILFIVLGTIAVIGWSRSKSDPLSKNS